MTDDDSTLTLEQLRRMEALGAAGFALAAESPGNIFTKGPSRTPAAPNGLVAVAHFIVTGGRDYLPTELDRAIISAIDDQDPPTEVSHE